MIEQFYDIKPQVLALDEKAMELRARSSLRPPSASGITTS